MSNLKLFQCILYLIVLTKGLIGQSEELLVSVQGKYKNGEYIVRIFAEANSDEFPMGKPDVELRKSVNFKEVINFNFIDLKPGKYAVMVFHDENMNGKLDTNFIGIPKEAVAASNDAKGRMGPPEFTDAAVSVPKGENPKITITLKNRS